MITGITIKNFKSFQEATLPLKGLTVLIGANASGKSNAIEALRLLSWLAHGGKLSNFSQYGKSIVRGRIPDLSYLEGSSFSFEVETDRDPDNNESKASTLSITVSRRNADELHITQEDIKTRDRTIPLYELKRASSGRSMDVTVAFDNFAQGVNKPLIRCIDQSAVFTQLTSPAPFSGYEYSQKYISDTARMYEKILSSMLFLDSVPAAMREYSETSDHIDEYGSNLSGVLYNLWGNSDQAETPKYKANRTDILNFIQSLPEQKIMGLEFYKEPRGTVLVRLVESFGITPHPCDASLLSDGTLRVLSIAAAMLSADEGSLVVIEEIDNGVHPSRASHLMESIRSVAERRNLRVLITTHNPALLDALPDSAIPDVVLCYRDPKNGSSKLVRLEDIPDYPELIAQGTLGDLVTTGVLERFVKQPHDDEERKRKALAWLERMKKGDEQ
jgi:predicted ATPase